MGKTWAHLLCCALQVHERTLQGDFLMALLRDLLISRRSAGNPLKVTLQSSQQSRIPKSFLNYAGVVLRHPVLRLTVRLCLCIRQHTLWRKDNARVNTHTGTPL